MSYKAIVLVALFSIMLLPSLAAETPKPNTVTGSQMAEAAVGFLKGELKKSGLDYYNIEIKNTPRDRKTRAGKVSFSFSLRRDLKIPGFNRVTVWVMIDDKKEFYNDVSLMVTTKKEVLAANRPIEKGEILKDDMLSIIPIEEKRVSKDNYITKKDVALGYVLKKSVTAGTPLTFDLIEKPIEIKNGDTVTVKVINKNLVLSSFGIAKNSGAIGDEIQVKLVYSNKILTGVVSENKEIIVELP